MKRIPFNELRHALLKFQVENYIDLKDDNGLSLEEFTERIANCHLMINACEDVHDLLDYLAEDGYHGTDAWEFLVTMMVEETEHIGRADQ
jgi:hypothetical protein